VPTEVPTDAAGLCNALIAQREYTLALYADLPAIYWEPDKFPFHTITNPPLWELAHIGWFQEFFALRWRVDDVTGARTPSCLDVADQLFDSRTVAHKSRWQLAYPSKATCLAYMQRVLDNVVDALNGSDSGERYGFQLVLVHEDMHAEALMMTLTTLGLARPDDAPERATLPADLVSARQISVAGGAVQMSGGGRSFAFDNEKSAHTARIAPFVIDARVVSGLEFAAFVASDAYRDPQLWSVDGNAWREARQASRRSQQPGMAAMHVSLFEAQAYCRWKNRRLPTEAEWEHAATSSDEFFASTGHVWEWTASAFAPYPGFQAERYREYSEPWFHSHQVLRGGSFVTHPRLRYPQYRNFYTPERDDMFCGFRTCAIG
jgi:gamma-glutamyl hercynylcysteine S-oxide synthase